MRCETIGRQLSELAMDDASSNDAFAIRSHLGECEDCGSRFERERDTATLIREWSEPDFNDDDRERLRLDVRVAIEAGKAGHRRPGSTVRIAAAASIAAIAILLGLAGMGRVGGPMDGEAMAGPATRAEDTEPGVFTMVGPFSAKERVESRRSVDKPRRSDQKPRRVFRRTPEPRPTPPATALEVQAGDSDSMMRFEFQTQDPKVRIIWFVPRAEEGTPSSSEIGD